MQVAKVFPVRKGSHPGKLLDHSPATSISLSKLADESQLGSLSKLLTPAHNNNVNDCNYESWPTEEVAVDSVTKKCAVEQYETTLHYKSFMPLKKRFRQDFPNDIVKETTKVSIDPISTEEVTSTETSPLTIEEESDVTSVDECQILKLDVASPKIVDDYHQEGRTTKFRACKGERYKMFMNSNRRTRNKTQREIDLQQRINDLANLDMEDYNNKTHYLRNKRSKKVKSKRKKRQSSPTKSTASLESFDCHKNENDEFFETLSEDNKSFKEETNLDIKNEVKIEYKCNGNSNFLNNKENGMLDDIDNKPINVGDVKLENNVKISNADITADNLENKTGNVVGSRKRKLRKQNIMRLQPGSTFKDMRVVEDSVVCDLGTLAEVAVSSEQKSMQH